MRLLLICILSFGPFGSATCQSRDSTKAVANWRSLRVGLFIHWGPSSGRALPESHSHARNSALNPHGSIPAAVYDQFYKEFNPVNYNPDEWLSLAHAAGMRYAVFVAKHHDGFCMFNTDATGYNIMATPYGKDVAAMFAEACKRQGMALGWQISPKDWKHPDFNTNQEAYNAYYLKLIDNLTNNYGPVSILWFDGIEPVALDQWKTITKELPEMVYARQQGMMLGIHGAVKEDFVSFETMVGPYDRTRPWETCEPINPSGWVYNKPMPPFPFRDLLRNLVYTVSRDGNYLLDVGPMEDGKLYPPDAARLQELAAWMKINAEGIHGTRGGPYRDGAWGASTCKGNNVFLFVSNRVKGSLVLPVLNARIISARRLDGGPVSCKQDGQSLRLTFSDRAASSVTAFTGVKLELDRPAYDVPLVDGQSNLAASARVAASSIRYNDETLYGPSLLFDNRGETAWQTMPGDTLNTLEFDFGKPVVLGSLSLSERGQIQAWNHSFKLTMSVRNKESEKWKTVLTQAGTLGGPPILGFEPGKYRFAKIQIRKKPSVQLQVAELRLFGPL